MLEILKKSKTPFTVCKFLKEQSDWTTIPYIRQRFYELYREGLKIYDIEDYTYFYSSNPEKHSFEQDCWHKNKGEKEKYFNATYNNSHAYNYAMMHLEREIFLCIKDIL